MKKKMAIDTNSVDYNDANRGVLLLLSATLGITKGLWSSLTNDRNAMQFSAGHCNAVLT